MPEEILSEKTHLRCTVIIEVLGKPKEHVEKSIRDYTDKIDEDSNLIILKKDFSDAEEKEGLWSTFVELDMVIKGLPKLISFCFDYMPSSVEIIKPEELLMSRETIADFANDLQARLHQVDMVVKQLKNENTFLKKNLNAMMKNTIAVALAPGMISSDKLSKITGIKEEELTKILKSMIDEGKIKQKDTLYGLAAMM